MNDHFDKNYKQKITDLTTKINDIKQTTIEENCLESYNELKRLETEVKSLKKDLDEDTMA